MAINTIHNELHLDNNPYDQPENTYRDSRNGVIMHMGGTNYSWKNIKGTILSFDLGINDPILSWCWIRERLFVITLNEYENWVKISEIIFDENGIGVIQVRYVGSNEILGFSFDNPITKMIGFYENDEIQRIYFTNNHDQPKVINIGSSNITIEGKEKFLNFYPPINNPYGKLSLVSVYGGGNLYAGTYFICWQYYTKDGYYSDWSPLSNPITITGDIPAGVRGDDYQDYQGKNYTKNTFRRINIKLENLDADYDKIRIAAFFSNDYNSIESGIIFYDGAVSEEIETIYTGSENIGSVTVNEVSNISVLIERCKDIAIIKDMMVLSNLKERAELDVKYANTANKNDRMDCKVSLLKYNIVLDYTNVPTGSWNTGYKSLQNSIKGANVATYFLPNIWYKNIGGENIVYKTSDDVVHTIFPGWFFKPSEYISGYDPVSGPIYTLIAAEPHIVLLRYRKSTAELPEDEIANQGIHINQGWVFDAYSLRDQWLDYKSSKISHYLKGYPQGERVRLGIVFFDETGRPFFARWLNNTELEYSINGDVQLPLRNQSTNRLVSKHVFPNNYVMTMGHINGFRIKGIDITEIKDRVKGMMIVRAPIIRKYEASGILLPIYYSTARTEGRMMKWFSTFSDNTHYDSQGYTFFCPEDIFELSGFSIQPGDHIVNNMYLKARDAANIYKTDWEGFGYLEKDTSNKMGFIQKFYDDASLSGVSNGEIGARHEVLFYTKFKTGDKDDSVYDSRDVLKKYKNQPREHFIGDKSWRSDLNDHAILILDITHGTSQTDIKGIHNIASNNAHALVCLVEKPIDNTYGGIGDVSLAGTRYISTGHYQIINDQVLSDIENNERYIFNDIDIFGGDTFIGMFDHCKWLADESRSSNTLMYNSSFIVPLESRINFAMRGDNHIARNRSHHTDNLLGLIRSDNNNRWENYNYNDAYSTDNIDAYYLSLPYNFLEQNTFDVRHRYSNIKSYGELRDSFRKYDALSFLDVYSQFGAIVNTATTKDYLIYWQPDMVGYIPVSERATQTGQLGQPIQIGIGGVFERHDEIIKQVGNSNHFGLVESMHGFHWFDAKRKLFISLPLNMQLSFDSITKGADSFFNSIPSFSYQYDNPIKDYGMFGGYDSENNMLYYSFIMPNDYRETISINSKSGNLAGFWDFNSRMYISTKNIFLGIDNEKSRVYKHNSGTDGTLYGKVNDAYITLVIKENDMQEKIFDSFVMIGNNQFFDEIIYANSSQEITELIHGNRNYKFRNNRWYGNFPKVTRQRFVDGYMIVTMKVTDPSKSVMFTRIISQLTNMY